MVLLSRELKQIGPKLREPKKTFSKRLRLANRLAWAKSYMGCFRWWAASYIAFPRWESRELPSSQAPAPHQAHGAGRPGARLGRPAGVAPLAGGVARGRPQPQGVARGSREQ